MLNSPDLNTGFQNALQQILTRLGKLDVLEQRMNDLQEDIRDLREAVKGFLPRTEYERKGNTGKLEAIRKELADFKIETLGRIETRIKETIESSEAKKQQSWTQHNSKKTLIIGSIMSVGVALFSFLLTRFFSH